MTAALRLAADDRRPLPYGQHLIDQADIDAVVAALTSGCLAHGPRVGGFEQALATEVDAREAVACSSGTAALHLALAALDVGPGDTCIVPAITFLSTATAVRFCGAEVVFADVDPISGLMTADTLDDAFARAATPIKAVLPVHLGGRICDMPALAGLARGHGAFLVEDACHALGGADSAGRKVGGCDLSDAAVFSFHPVKTIAAGEGGAVTLNDPIRAERMRRLRNHGVTRDPALLSDAALSLDAEGQPNPWSYEQLELGFNYRMNEMEAALATSQLGKLKRFVQRRAELAAAYDQHLREVDGLIALGSSAGDRPSLHLYQIHMDFDDLRCSRGQVMRRMSAAGVQTQVHYIPLNRQGYFQRRYGRSTLPGAERFYSSVLALPLFPAMTDQDVDWVVRSLQASIA